MPISQRKALIARRNIVVALVLENEGQEDECVAIIVRAKVEVNVVRLVFLNMLFILSCTSHFFPVLTS